MNRNKQKGDLLENAVMLIEQTVLSNSTGLDRASFRILRNQIRIVDGVRHEIDLVVEINHEHEYNSLFIFECKNTKRPVGKSAIIDFTEKVRALSAQKGFFVSKAYSKHAKAQASLNDRLVLLDAKEYPIEHTRIPIHLHYLNKVSERSRVTILPSHHIKIASVDLDKARCLLNGARIKLRKYVGDWAKECADARINGFPTGEKSSGRYFLHAGDDRAYENETFFIDGNRISKIQLQVEIEVEVFHPSIISHFDIPSRGRVISLESLPLNAGGSITMHLLGGLPND